TMVFVVWAMWSNSPFAPTYARTVRSRKENALDLSVSLIRARAVLVAASIAVSSAVCACADIWISDNAPTLTHASSPATTPAHRVFFNRFIGYSAHQSILQTPPS